MSDDGRLRAAVVDRRVAVVSAVAAACGVGVLLCGFLPWYGVESAVRIGETVEVEATLWGDQQGDLVLALLVAAGVGFSALTAAIAWTARPTSAAWLISLAAAVGFALALLIVVERLGDAPGEAATRYGATVALILAIIATAASALAARAGRRRP